MPALTYELPDSPPEQHTSHREKIGAAIKSVSDLIKAATAPLPTQTGDGSIINKQKSTGVLKDVVQMRPRDVLTLVDLAKEAITGEPINDKTFLMERLVELSSKLPMTSKLGASLSDTFVQQLYDDLQHPPVSFLGDAHKYRSADGSFNVSARRFGTRQDNFNAGLGETFFTWLSYL